MAQPTIIEVHAEEEFVARAHAMIKEKVLDAQKHHGSCILGLSGGSTPGPVYASLAGDREIAWGTVVLFLVDDRFVPPDHKDSNQKLIHDMLLSKIEGTEKPTLLFPDTRLPLAECVTTYEDDLRTLMTDRPADLVILGMGEDGHTASLFPGDESALKEEERWVLHTETEVFAVKERITVTMPVMRKARMKLFLISGNAKRAFLQSLLHEEVPMTSLPAAALNGHMTTWIVRTDD